MFNRKFHLSAIFEFPPEQLAIRIFESWVFYSEINAHFEIEFEVEFEVLFYISPATHIIVDWKKRTLPPVWNERLWTRKYDE